MALQFRYKKGEDQHGHSPSAVLSEMGPLLEWSASSISTHKVTIEEEKKVKGNEAKGNESFSVEIQVLLLVCN